MSKKNKLPCPHCGVESISDVSYSRTNKSLGSINRTRKCGNCGHSFSTIEVTIKAFGILRDKIEAVDGIFNALLAHPKITELLNHAKKEALIKKNRIKTKRRRGTRRGISS